MATIRYVESGYVEAGYFQVVVQADAISLTVTSTVSCNAEEFLAATRYVEEGYWNAGYTETIKYLDPLTLATAVTISADLTEVTETEGSATLSSSFGLTSNSGLLLTMDGDDSTSLSIASTVSSTAVKTVDAQADFGALFTPSITTGTIKVITATLVSSISMNATVSKFSGNEATLSNIVNLSLQGVKTAVFDSSLSTSFSQSASANKTTNTSTALSSLFSTTTIPGSFKKASAHLTQNFILFTSKWPNRGRPVSWNKYIFQSGSTTAYTGSNIAFSSTDKQYGTHSLQFKTNVQRVLSSNLDVGYYSSPNNIFIRAVESSQNFVWEFWAKMENDNFGGTNNVVATIRQSNSTPDLNDEYDSPSTGVALMIGAKADKITAKFRERQTGTFRELSSTSSSSNWSSNWHHIVLRRYNGNTVELRVDNSVVDTYTFSGDIGGSTGSNQTNTQMSLHSWDQIPGGGDTFFDGVHFQLGSSTYTGYSSNPAGTGTENTLVLANFDNNFDDDLGITLEASATLEASGGVLSAIGGIFGVTTNLTATTSVTADIEVLRTASATLTSSTSVSATALRIKDSGSTTLNTASTVGVTAVRQLTASSSANSVFTTQIDSGAVRNAIGNFDSIATQLSAVSKIGDFLIDADVTATVSAQPNFIASGVATIASDFAQTTNETLFKSFSATLTTNSSVVVAVNTIIDPTATLTSAFDTSTTGDRIRFGEATPNLVVNLSADNSTTKDFNAVLTSSFNVPAVNCNRTRPFVATVTSATTVNATVIKTVDAEATVDVAVSVTDVTPSVTRTLEALLPSVATQLTAVAKIGDFLIDADVVSALTVTARKTTGNITVSNIISTLTSDISLTKQGDSDLDSAITVNVEGTSNITGEADFDIVASVESTPVKIVTADATLSGAGGFDVTVVATRNNEIIAISNVTQTADGDRIRFGIVDANVVVTGSFTAGKRVSTTSEINSNITISADVRVINIDDIVYKIPAETREYSIASEAREHTIVKETREHTVT